MKYPLLPLPKAQQYFNELARNVQHIDCFMKFTFKVTKRAGKKNVEDQVVPFRTSDLDNLSSGCVFLLLMSGQNYLLNENV